MSDKTGSIVYAGEDFSVKVKGRSGVIYEDRIGTAYVDGEMLAGPSGFVIYRDSIRSLDDGNADTLNAVRRDLIVENVRRAFARNGFNIEIS